MKNKNRKKRGFTLIEVMISIAIFSMIMIGLAVFSSGIMNSHMKSRAMQNSLDNARFAIEGLEKRIRTSNGVTTDALGSSPGENYPDGDTQIFVIDNVDQKHYCYKFLNNELVVYQDPSADPTSADCSTVISAGASPIVLVGDADNKVEVTGRFILKKTDITSGTKRRGLVTTTLKIHYSGSEDTSTMDTSEITLESSVSLRDYAF